MNFTSLAKSLSLVIFFAIPATAAQLNITVTNLTHGNYFTPLLLAAHGADQHLFQTGEIATLALQKMAEGGDITDLAAAITASDGVIVSNPANGLMTPGSKVTNIILDSKTQTHLSLVAMLLPTNDAFVGLDTWEIPKISGTYTIHLNAYDAGTEANDEIINGGGMVGVAGIPAAPGEDGGSNAIGISDGSSNNKVHVHPGILGDTDSTGGPSDLDSRIHRWLNPVASIVVEVK